MAFWGALGLGAISGLTQGAAGMFQQRYQNEFVSSLYRQQFEQAMALQKARLNQEQNNKNETSMLNAEIAGASTPSAIMKSATQTSEPSEASGSGGLKETSDGISLQDMSSPSGSGESES